jgi:hypothetical protein
MPSFRKRITPRIVLAVTGVSLLTAVPTVAQEVTIAGTGTFATAPGFPPGFTSGPFTFSLVLPQSPTGLPIFPMPGGALPELFTIGGPGVPVTFVQGANTIVAQGAFSAYTAAGQGGIRFAIPGITYFSPVGPVVFTGTVATPTFTPGVYIPTGTRGGPTEGQPSVSTITSFSITATAVPEPSTVALTATGLLTVAGAAYRRRRS